MGEICSGCPLINACDAEINRLTGITRDIGGFASVEETLQDSLAEKVVAGGVAPGLPSGDSKFSDPINRLPDREKMIGNQTLKSFMDNTLYGLDRIHEKINRIKNFKETTQATCPGEPKTQRVFWGRRHHEPVKKCAAIKPRRRLRQRRRANVAAMRG